MTPMAREKMMIPRIWREEKQSSYVSMSVSGSVQGYMRKWDVEGVCESIVCSNT